MRVDDRTAADVYSDGEQATSVFAPGAVTGTTVLSTTVDSQTITQSVEVVEPSTVLYLPVIMNNYVDDVYSAYSRNWR